MISPHLTDVEDILRIGDWLRAELSDWHQPLDAVVESDDTAKVFDADDVAVGNAAGTGVVVAEEQRQGAFDQGFLSGQVQLLVLRIYRQHLKTHK